MENEKFSLAWNIQILLALPLAQEFLKKMYFFRLLNLLGEGNEKLKMSQLAIGNVENMKGETISRSAGAMQSCRQKMTVLMETPSFRPKID